MAHELKSLVFVFNIILLVNSNMISLKVVNELPSTGYSNLHGMDTKLEERLKLRMEPGNVTGPDHLHDLLGQCFKHRDAKYEYIFCPFQNITQEDFQAYYEPYKGVLGVWYDWIIEDNKFVGMNMIEGSSCGSHNHRSTKVSLNCGPSSELKSVTEPEKCKYVAEFQTPEVCGENSVAVYPRLPQYLQQEWDELESDKHNGDLTKKGYDKGLEKIFTSAKLILTPEDRSSLKQKVVSESTKNCKQELDEARLRIVELEEELRMKEEIILELEDGKADV